MNPILLAAALLATPDFPEAIQRDLGLATRPRCTICHATEAGGTGTAVQPFAVYLRSRGLRPFDESSLQNALQAAAGERHSSSGNGVTDIDALRAGQDPNGTAAVGGETPLSPAYGCSSASAPDLMALAALVGAWLCRRRRLQEIPDGSHSRS